MVPIGFMIKVMIVGVGGMWVAGVRGLSATVSGSVSGFGVGFITFPVLWCVATTAGSVMVWGGSGLLGGMRGVWRVGVRGVSRSPVREKGAGEEVGDTHCQGKKRLGE